MLGTRVTKALLTVGWTGFAPLVALAVELAPPPVPPLAGVAGVAGTTRPAQHGLWPATHQLAVDVADREAVRTFYNTVYRAGENVPMGWTGDVAACNAGTTSQAYIDAVLLRVNYFRLMAGVPPLLRLDTEFNRLAQQASLLMAANRALNHNPPESWVCYSADGARGAASSSLGLDTTGPEAITLSIQDFGAFNGMVGHRRWIFFPQTQVMGTGNIPKMAAHPAANALWLFDEHIEDERPPVRDNYVVWPPRGYVPYQMTFPRWSFSYPGADFLTAVVTMSSNGVAIPVRREQPATGAGEETVVWVPMGLDADRYETQFPKPAGDTVYTVTVNDVYIDDQPRAFVYAVKVFDPAVPSASYSLPTVVGSDRPFVQTDNGYSISGPAFASGFEVRVHRRTPFDFLDGAENGTENFAVDTSGYVPVISNKVASGLKAFRFIHPVVNAPPPPQILRFNRQLFPTTNAAVQFRSMLGWATATQVARVQVSFDDGEVWEDVFSQAGTGTKGQTSYATNRIELGRYSGRSLVLRFYYEYLGGTYYNQADPGVGWHFDDIHWTGFEELTDPTVTRVPTGSPFVFRPAEAGSYALQARAEVYGDFHLEWGPLKNVSTQAGSPRIALQSPPVLAAGQLIFEVAVSSLGPSFSLEIERASGFPAVWAKESGAVVEGLEPGARYRITIPVGAPPHAFYRVKATF